MKAHLERMIRWMAWADRRVMEALRSQPGNRGESLPLLAHLLAAEHIWLARLNGREPVHPVWPQLDLAECEKLADENAAGYAGLIRQTDEAGLQAAVRYRNSQGEEFRTAAIDILTQVLSHGAYHRGQVVRELKENGGRAASTDYITFVRSADSQ